MIEPPHDSRLARAKLSGNSMRQSVGVMICPRCELPLQGCDHTQGIAWRCGKCGGQSLNFSQFRRMVPEDGANAIWENATARPNPPQRRTPCPECHNGMDAVHIPLHDHRIELDVCRPCQRLWLDRLEDDGIVSLSLAPAPVRRRRWFAARGATQRGNSEIQRNPGGERIFGKSEDTGRERWELSSLVRGVIVGIVVYFMLWPLPAWLRFRLTAIVVVLYVTLRLLRR